MTLAEFDPLGPAEQRLVDWLKAGNRGDCVISEGVPTAETPATRLRASLIRHLALGGCDACRPPATGVRARGAWIAGDDARGGQTKGLDFEGATLPGDLALVACRIPNLILLRSGNVKNLFLNGSHLGAGIAGDRLRAEGNVVLRGAIVDGTICLPGARIDGDLNCKGAKLRATGAALIADRLQTEGNVILSKAEVDGTVRLLGAQIGSDLDCVGAKLRAKVDALMADGARITGTLFLREGAELAGLVSLTAAEIGAINDDPACWPPRIELDRCRYGAILGDAAPTDARRRLDWLSRIPNRPGEFWPDPYEHCAKVLREMGHTGAARTILIAKEHRQRAARRIRVARDDPNFGAPRAAGMWLRDQVLNLTVRYGRAPLLAFVWLALFWALGTWVFGQAAQTGQIKPNLPQMLVHPAWVDCRAGGARRGDEATRIDCFHAQPEGASYPAFNALFYSADTLFPVVSFEVQSYWIPDDREPFGKWARWYLWFHITVGWALTLLAVAGFSGLIKTDSR